MKIKIIKMSASSFYAEERLEDNFLKELQDVLDNGGQIVSIVQDSRSFKKAYVLTKGE